MPIFPYKKDFPIADADQVILKIVFPDPGTAGHHSIDLPGPADKEGYNELIIPLGIGNELKKERTIIFSKIGNMDINNENVRIEYFLNDKLIQEHSNLKNVDRSPMIKLAINFIDYV